MATSNEQYFRKKLMQWHKHDNKRELPWKGEKNVYRIWLSEIILQQTRAGQGWKYYERFVEAYPNVEALAKAPIEEVYKLWEGLGYYNRCRNMHATAKEVVSMGAFPNTYDAILELKGIGPYTAAAISSFAFNLPYAVVDGNVFRVLSRFFGMDTAIDSTVGKKRFTEQAQNCLDAKQSAQYNQAIMDFGATVCKPDVPLCNTCVMKQQCVALKENRVTELPVKEKQTKQRSRWFIYHIIYHKGKFAVEQRMKKDVWQHLYEFPQVEFTSEKEWKQALKNGERIVKKPFRELAVTKSIVQKLSHQTIHASAVLLELPDTYRGKLPDWEWKTEKQLKQLPFPRIINDLADVKVLRLFENHT